MLAATARRAAAAAMRRAPVARVMHRRFADSAVKAEEGAASKPSFMDSLPKHPDYQGVEAVLRFYLPHNGQISIAVICMYTFIISMAMSSSNAAAIQEKLNAPAPEYPSFEDIKMKEVVGFPSIVEDTEAWVEFVSDESNVEAMVEAMNTE